MIKRSQDLTSRKENYIKKATLIHKDQFDYSKFIFINCKTKSTIICRKHNIEFQQNMDKHTVENAKGSCPVCLKEFKVNSLKNRKTIGKRSIIPKETFLKNSYDKFGLKFIYDLNNYNGLGKNKIKVFCLKHGSFLITPKNLFCNNKYGCKECSMENYIKNRTKPYEKLIEELKIKHNNLYSYPDTNKINFKNRESKIEIHCKIHGSYIKGGMKHLVGQGCPKCTTDKLKKEGILGGSYNEKYFSKYPERKLIKASIYYLKIGGIFKIGITVQDIKRRLRSLNFLLKKYNIEEKIEIIDIEELTLYEAYTFEKYILTKYKNVRIHDLGWSTEIFSHDVLDGKIRKFRSS
jgi:hypothetical protein